MKLVVDLRISQKMDNGGREALVIGGSRIDIVSSLSINAHGNSSVFE